MDNDGKPFAFINAEEITAFRTALTSSLLMVQRKKVKTVIVFGVGKQAYVLVMQLLSFSSTNNGSFWHLRLALLFHVRTITHNHILITDFS